jgi:hypothetical protein
VERLTDNIIHNEEIKEKNSKEEKSYINTRLNEIKDRDNNRLKFGENPLKIVNEIYENAKFSYKNKIKNQSSSENKEIINKEIYSSIIKILDYGNKIKILPKLIFDFNNFDKNTFSVKDRSNCNFNNFFPSNIINNYQANYYNNNFNFQSNNNNLNLNINFPKNFVPLISNNNPKVPIPHYPCESEEIKTPKNKNFNINNINIPQNILPTNNNANSMGRAYVCDICNEVFSNGQGLGGHMSRKHPNQSVKYKFKKETREKRNVKREIIYEAKRKILKKYHENYDELMNSIEGRKVIKRICKDNKDEYYRIKKEIKMQMK